MVAPFDLSRTLPVGGGLLVLCSIPGPPVIKQLMQSYYGAWPGWVVSISVLPLTTPPRETSYSRYFLGIGAEVSFFCNFFLLCMGVGLPAEQKSLPDLSQGFFCLKPAFTLVITAI